jgi:hypothetical protein
MENRPFFLIFAIVDGMRGASEEERKKEWMDFLITPKICR